MLELPPDIPVISTCAKALHVGWEEAEKCLFEEGYTFAEPSEKLEGTESDYWTARNLLNGKSLEDAIPKGDTTVVLDGGIEVTTLDSAFLLIDFANEGDSDDEVHRVYSSVSGSVVLLDDKASTSLMFFGTSHWESFESAFSFLSESSGEVDQLPIARLARTPFAVPDLNWLQEFYYRMIPSAWPDESEWEILAINPDEFQVVVGHQPRAVFFASYTVTREY